MTTTPLPVHRVNDCAPGTVYVLRNGVVSWHFTTGADWSLPPGIYVHVSDPRTDDELRRWTGGIG